ncbi:MAG TPA: site-specific integrase [Burkholderiaceae bacterium]|jgi:integrase
MLLTLSPQTHTLVDEQFFPRYWPAVWSLLYAGGLAASTHKRKLSFIEALYVHTEGLGGNLDDALSTLDFDALGNALEAYFISLRNAPEPSRQAEARWTQAFQFVRNTCDRIARNPAAGNRMEAIRSQVERLDRLYLALRPYKKRLQPSVRALPTHVVMELLDLAAPGSPANPFTRTETQWRIYCLVLLMLYQGLRRGETLTLKANSLQSQRDERTGKFRWLLHVTTNETEDDPRADVPGIKTVNSIRTVPVTGTTATAIQAYSDNYRGRVEHGFLISSVRERPMSIEGVSKAFQRMTTALSVNARAELLRLTGSPCLTPHALRHTCAVLRMKQLLGLGNSPEQAMSHLRSFFGWSKTSVMPMHYAKAALDERLNETWNDNLDKRLEVLRNLPQ